MGQISGMSGPSRQSTVQPLRHSHTTVQQVDPPRVTSGSGWSMTDMLTPLRSAMRLARSHPALVPLAAQLFGFADSVGATEALTPLTLTLTVSKAYAGGVNSSLIGTTDYGLYPVECMLQAQTIQGAGTKDGMVGGRPVIFAMTGELPQDEVVETGVDLMREVPFAELCGSPEDAQPLQEVLAQQPGLGGKIIDFKRQDRPNARLALGDPDCSVVFPNPVSFALGETKDSDINTRHLPWMTPAGTPGTSLFSLMQRVAPTLFVADQAIFDTGLRATVHTTSQDAIKYALETGHVVVTVPLDDGEPEWRAVVFLPPLPGVLEAFTPYLGDNANEATVLMPTDEARQQFHKDFPRGQGPGHLADLWLGQPSQPPQPPLDPPSAGPHGPHRREPSRHSGDGASSSTASAWPLSAGFAIGVALLGGGYLLRAGRRDTVPPDRAPARGASHRPVRQEPQGKAREEARTSGEAAKLALNGGNPIGASRLLRAMLERPDTQGVEQSMLRAFGVDKALAIWNALHDAAQADGKAATELQALQAYKRLMAPKKSAQSTVEPSSDTPKPVQRQIIAVRQDPAKVFDHAWAELRGQGTKARMEVTAMLGAHAAAELAQDFPAQASARLRAVLRTEPDPAAARRLLQAFGVGFQDIMEKLALAAEENPRNHAMAKELAALRKFEAFESLANPSTEDYLGDEKGWRGPDRQLDPDAPRSTAGTQLVPTEDGPAEPATLAQTFSHVRSKLDSKALDGVAEFKSGAWHLYVPGVKYPHLHLTENFATLSRGVDRHSFLFGPGGVYRPATMPAAQSALRDDGSLEVLRFIEGRPTP